MQTDAWPERDSGQVLDDGRVGEKNGNRNVVSQQPDDQSSP